MLDKMLLMVTENEAETAIPEYDEDTSYWDTMNSFHDVNTDYFSVNATTF